MDKFYEGMSLQEKINCTIEKSMKNWRVMVGLNRRFSDIDRKQALFLPEICRFYRKGTDSSCRHRQFLHGTDSSCLPATPGLMLVELL